jgi:Fe-S-cluster containining protein
VAGDDADDNICIDCGICCDGTLFARVALAGDRDVTMLADTPVRVQGSDSEPFLSQLCAAFDGCCSIYEVRPSNCRDFRCVLLRRHDRGEVSTDEARRIIHATVDIRNRALTAIRRRHAVDGLSFPEIQARLSEISDAADSASSEHMEMLLDVGATNTLLAKHFFGKPLRSSTTS